jgi:predicted NBD/HSP70 family sugar kinase
VALYALFDIGGTAIKYGVSDAEGHFVKNDTVNNPAKEKGIRGMLDVL